MQLVQSQSLNSSFFRCYEPYGLNGDDFMMYSLHSPLERCRVWDKSWPRLFSIRCAPPLQHRVARKWAGVIYSLPVPWEKSPSSTPSVCLGGCDDEWMTIWPDDFCFKNLLRTSVSSPRGEWLCQSPLHPVAGQSANFCLCFIRSSSCNFCFACQRGISPPASVTA